ncbi:MAG: galactose ABC transporter substrate-binding protein [Clostridium sp.]|uniref:galactose ABC transporter substrate-binding protein n=1 Tax=Clostridium sp. TaxID=1506 RepID=UPI003F3D6617
MWVKTLSVTLSLMLISNIFVGCKEDNSNSTDTLDEIKIGVSVYEKSDVFISSIIENLEKFAKERELEGKYKITLTVEDSKGKQYNQNDQVDKFVSQNYDIMCINLVDRRSAAFIIDKGENANIPVVFFNREPVEEDMSIWDKVHYIGARAEQSGILQADIVLDAYKNNKKSVDKNNDSILQYVMLEGEEEHQDALIRTEYSIKRLEESGVKLEKLGNDIANWNRDEAAYKMDKWIDEYGDKIEVVFSNNDEMALGAIDSYKSSKYNKNMPLVVGIDGVYEALKSIEEGSLTGTVLSDAYKQAKDIFDIAYIQATSEGTEEEKKILNRKYIREDHTTVTKENVKSFIER